MIFKIHQSSLHLIFYLAILSLFIFSCDNSFSPPPPPNPYLTYPESVRKPLSDIDKYLKYKIDFKRFSTPSFDKFYIVKKLDLESGQEYSYIEIIETYLNVFYNYPDNLKEKKGNKYIFEFGGPLHLYDNRKKGDVVSNQKDILGFSTPELALLHSDFKDFHNQRGHTLIVNYEFDTSTNIWTFLDLNLKNTNTTIPYVLRKTFSLPSDERPINDKQSLEINKGWEKLDKQISIKALEDFEKTRTSSRVFKTGYFNRLIFLGINHLKEGQFDEANKKFLNVASSITSSNSDGKILNNLKLEVYIRLAIAYQQSNQDYDAYNYFQKAFILAEKGSTTEALDLQGWTLPKLYTSAADAFITMDEGSCNNLSEYNYIKEIYQRACTIGFGDVTPMCPEACSSIPPLPLTSSKE